MSKPTRETPRTEYQELLDELERAYLGHKECLARLGEARKDEKFMREQICELLEQMAEPKSND